MLHVHGGGGGIMRVAAAWKLGGVDAHFQCPTPRPGSVCQMQNQNMVVVVSLIGFEKRPPWRYEYCMINKLNITRYNIQWPVRRSEEPSLCSSRIGVKK